MLEKQKVEVFFYQNLLFGTKPPPSLPHQNLVGRTALKMSFQ